MAKKVKANLEFLLAKAEVKGVPEKGLLRYAGCRFARVVAAHLPCFMQIR